jgi:hypothetical protein
VLAGHAGSQETPGRLQKATLLLPLLLLLLLLAVQSGAHSRTAAALASRACGLGTVSMLLAWMNPHTAFWKQRASGWEQECRGVLLPHKVKTQLQQFGPRSSVYRGIYEYV